MLVVTVLDFILLMFAISMPRYIVLFWALNCFEGIPFSWGTTSGTTSKTKFKSYIDLL